MTLKLQVGKTYERADGTRIKIIKDDMSCYGFRFMGTGGCRHTVTGQSINGPIYDLIREVPDRPKREKRKVASCLCWAHKNKETGEITWVSNPDETRKFVRSVTDPGETVIRVRIEEVK